MNREPIFVITALALTAVGVWSLCMVGVMLHYGSFVIDRPYNPLGAEAQIGVFLGFLYALPGLLLLTVVGWVKRKGLPRVLVLAPIVVTLAACVYFGYLRVLIASAVPP
ncbi:hypothetical protein C7S18_06100 [Ahniella affigens]|uniref:Uncharacterized protein n=1 Tax=Ahniella affigens TaxID=2021234 RepID=A0A2P1PPM6_9GAMM|nr:hypothetical protein C7S18_06100 [Ahniella affigens]